jgi:hypothetical protein
MYANFSKNAIEMSATESKAAGKFGSPEFNELQGLRAAYPTFQILIKAPKKAKNQLKIDYKFMEEYIKAHDDDKGTIMDELLFLRGKKAKEDEYTETVNFMEIKNWFLKKFPEIKKAQKEYREKIDKILNAA